MKMESLREIINKKQKKMEKKLRKKSKGLEYYAAVLDKLVNLNTTVFSKKELYKIMDEVSEGGGYSTDPSLRTVSLKRFEEILTDKWLEKVNDKDNKCLYSLKLTKGQEKEDLEQMKALFTNFYMNIGERISAGRNGGKEQKNTKKQEFSSILGKPKRESFEKFWRILCWMEQNKKNEIKLTEIRTLIGGNFSECTLSSWIKSFENINMIIDAVYVSMNRGKSFVRIHNNIISTKLQVQQAAYRCYGLILDGARNIKPLRKGEQERGIQRVVIRESEEEVYKTIFYAIAGIIMKNNEKPVGSDNICSILLKEFGIHETKKEIIEHLRRRPEFNLIKHGELIELKDGIDSWEDIKTQFGPERKKKTVFARLTLPFEEIKKHFPGTKQESKISDNDAIYKIETNDSVHSLKEWVLLYRKLREPDKIFDDELVDKIKKEIIRIDILSFKDNFAYEIEELL